MNSNVTKTAFGENGEIVAVSDFQHPGEESAATGREADEMALLRHCLFVTIKCGHRDALAPRLGALLRLVGGYSNDAEVARRLNVSVRSVTRAKKRLFAALEKSSAQIALWQLESEKQPMK